MVMKTFACDESAVKGESFLRADYSISCHSDKHRIYSAYAMFMVLVSNLPVQYSLLRSGLRLSYLVSPLFSWDTGRRFHCCVGWL